MSYNKYSESINLPKTSFPMRANLANREPKWIELWQKTDVYKKAVAKHTGNKKFVLHDGPPYANGKIHIGHAVNKILKDIIVKSKLMSGYEVNYIPGWDCHGLPIEMTIEKKHSKVGPKMTASQFRTLCREFADEQIEQQKQDFIRLGILGDWEKPYKTKDFSVEANEILALKELYSKGYIRRGLKPVYWSTGCESALAEAEVEYHDKKSQAIDVLYPTKNIESFLNKINFTAPNKITSLGIVIWTTTPWTLPASQAVALHKDIEYALIEYQQLNITKHIIIAKELIEPCSTRFNIEANILCTFKGKSIEGQLFSHPFYKRDIPIILGEHVSTESGTGCVHTAPAHGPEDFIVGKIYQLDSYCPVNDKGIFYPNTELVGGQFVHKAESFIINTLKEQDKLLANNTITHSYPFCWRSKTPLIYRATSQWFVSMDNVLDKAINLIDKVKFTPSWGKDRMSGMLNSRPDWCISRQRYWGVPIPFITHKQTGEMHPNIMSIIDTVADAVKTNGINAWFEFDLVDLIGDNAEHYEKSTDVLDVWFDSGLTHRTLNRKDDGLTFPADLYLEGSDQHRGWFQSSLLTGVALNNQPPYKALLTHGFTVDKNGRKMSKSEGNIIEPQKIFNTLGADILRLWIATSDYRQEMSVSDEIFKRVSDSYRRIRNTMRYLIGNTHDFDIQKNEVPFENQLAIDRWMIAKAHTLQLEIIEAYNSYDFHNISKKIQHFCTIQLGSFYLDILKDRLYTCQKDSLARRSAQTTLWHLGQAMTRWLAPILSFTSEEIWQEISSNNEESIFLQTWHDQLQALAKDDPFDDSFWQELYAIKSNSDKVLESLRQSGDIGSSLDAEITLYANDELRGKLSLLGDELRFVFITCYAHIEDLKNCPSQLEKVQDNLAIEAKVCPYNKCARSWHRRKDVGTDPNYPDLDKRSIINVYGDGETRFYV